MSYITACFANLAALEVRSYASDIVPCHITNNFGEPCTTEYEFDDLIDSVITEFSPDFQTSGWKLSSTSEWQNEKEEATYEFVNSSEIAVKIYGGLVRASDITLDAAALVICHEIGHVYGFITGTGSPDTWGAEGEADYFAASSCLDRVLKYTPSKSNFSLPASVIKSCNTRSENPEICLRKNRAAYSGSIMRARVLSEGTVSFLTPDPTIVSTTTHDLTSAQCGLDTFYQASLDLARPKCWFYQ